jgi:uncharacterized membrane protein
MLYNISLVILIYNSLLLLFLGISKLVENGCSTCNSFSYLPFSEIYLAFLGSITSLILTALVYYSNDRNYLRHASLFLTFFASSFGSFLLVGQISINKSLCYPCVLSTILFYIVFIIVLYNSIMRKISGSMLRV